jgi:hypothetical protein
MTNRELGLIAEEYALTLDGFSPRPSDARYDCLYRGEPCDVKAPRGASYTQSSGERIEETVWWLWVLMDGDTGEVLAHEIVPKGEHNFGRAYVNYKYVAPAYVTRRFDGVLGTREVAA